jgi:hypothetical protein
MSKKEIMIQLGLSVAVLLFFGVKDTFFPAKPKATPTPSATPIIEQSGAQMLDAAAIALLNVKLPKVDGQWRVFVINDAGTNSYTLLSSNVADASLANLTRPGYEINTAARVNVKDLDALKALMMKIPTNDTITVIGANGFVVDNITFALIAEGARKSGLNIKMGTWSGPVITLTPAPTK